MGRDLLVVAIAAILHAEVASLSDREFPITIVEGAPSVIHIIIAKFTSLRSAVSKGEEI